ncbi:hypothetical protein DEFDS_1478 [Deferribacter desulfuricans SSM1]|uniref:Uncharacterized protein n=1 Tax=Deferribacter desulfuricans (strain DSM 14783 / JCM 11476 / NBRC 101012 / SSM1) TaxID=639282 RepID=D3PEB5_DEFDS|nr:hypothetical protein [Deferribacter desulfuricans]BAI80938.1 hypothetical protein DEFDS_1478 [Deferribacter desulfuricans SSM1]
MILIFTNKDEKELIYEIKSKRVEKVGFVCDSLPLISNLNLIENLLLIVEYHGLNIDKNSIVEDLKRYNLFNKRYYRKDSLELFEIFFVKYLMCKYFQADTICFVNQFHSFVHKREIFYEFFRENYSENFVIIERDVYKKLLIDNLKLKEMDLDLWLKNGLKT